MNHKENIIPPAVWKFVKSVAASPITAGILALIISNFINKNKKTESLTISERLDKLTEGLKDWKDIGGNPTSGKVRRWSNGKDTLYITKSKFGKYSVGLNKSLLNDKNWYDTADEAEKYAKTYMRGNK